VAVQPYVRKRESVHNGHPCFTTVTDASALRSLSSTPQSSQNVLLQVPEKLVQRSQQPSVTGGGRTIDTKNVVNNRVGVGWAESVRERSCGSGYLVHWVVVGFCMGARARPFLGEEEKMTSMMR